MQELDIADESVNLRLTLLPTGYDEAVVTFAYSVGHEYRWIGRPFRPARHTWVGAVLNVNRRAGTWRVGCVSCIHGAADRNGRVTLLTTQGLRLYAPCTSSISLPHPPKQDSGDFSYVRPTGFDTHDRLQ